MASRAHFVEKAIAIDSAIEQLKAAELAADVWIRETYGEDEVPEMFREYLHENITLQIPILEKERVRLDTVLESMNAGHNVGHNVGHNAGLNTMNS